MIKLLGIVSTLFLLSTTTVFSESWIPQGNDLGNPSAAASRNGLIARVNGYGDPNTDISVFNTFTGTETIVAEYGTVAGGICWTNDTTFLIYPTFMQMGKVKQVVYHSLTDSYDYLDVPVFTNLSVSDVVNAMAYDSLSGFVYAAIVHKAGSAANSKWQFVKYDASGGKLDTLLYDQSGFVQNHSIFIFDGTAVTDNYFSGSGHYAAIGYGNSAGHNPVIYDLLGDSVAQGLIQLPEPYVQIQDMVPAFETLIVMASDLNGHIGYLELTPSGWHTILTTGNSGRSLLSSAAGMIYLPVTNNVNGEIKNCALKSYDGVTVGDELVAEDFVSAQVVAALSISNALYLVGEFTDSIGQIHPIVKLEQVFTTVQPASPEIQLYPNPATDAVHVKIDDGMQHILTVFNQEGQWIASEKFSGQITVSMNHLPSGQ